MRDTVDPEFASYVDARQTRWLRSAYLVYGDLDRAEEQLLHAFSRLAPQWGKVDDPDVFVQRLLYQPALPHWAAAPWNHPSPQPGDEDPVRTALAGLSAVQRTVFVLLYFDELTEFEIADVLNLSHNSVHGHALSALTAFRTGLGYGDWRNAGNPR